MIDRLIESYVRDLFDILHKGLINQIFDILIDYLIVWHNNESIDSSI